MSGLVSGITKIFTSIGTGLSATLGSAVRAVGATFFTASAATGTGLAEASSGGGILGGLLGGGGSVLGNILGGAVRMALVGGLTGGLIGAVTGKGFGRGFETGALIGGGIGALGGAFQPTGLEAAPASATGGPLVPAPDTATGAQPNLLPPGSRALGASLDRASVPDYLSTTAAAQAAAPASAVAAPAAPAVAPVPTPASPTKGLGEFLKSAGGAALIGGVGEAISAYALNKDKNAADMAYVNYLRDRDARITASYDVPNSAFPGFSNVAPASAARQKFGREVWKYNPTTGQIEPTRVA